MAKYIQSSEHAIIGSSGSPAETVAPGERVLLNEEVASHKLLVTQIEAGDPSVSHLSIVEVDADAERKQQEEQQEQLAKAEEIAAKARDEQLQADLEAQESSHRSRRWRASTCRRRTRRRSRSPSSPAPASAPPPRRTWSRRTSLARVRARAGVST
jgi:hypothetical protein